MQVGSEKIAIFDKYFPSSRVVNGATVPCYKQCATALVGRLGCGGKLSGSCMSGKKMSRGVCATAGLSIHARDTVTD